jgi:hypothetical protein
MLEHDGGRHRRGIGVELPEEAGQDLSGAVLHSGLHAEELRAKELATAEEADLNAGVPAGTLGDRNDVGACAAGADDLLLLDDVLHRRDAVAKLGRPFEVPSIGRLVHLHFQGPDNLLRLTVEKERRLLDGPHVRRPVDGRDAGRGALLEVIVETEIVVPRDLLVALPIRKEPIEQVEGSVGRPGRGVRTKVGTAVIENQSSQDDPRPLLVGDLKVGIGLVVLEHDVVLRLVPLDEFVLKDQSLGRRIGPDHLEIGYVAHKFPRLGVVSPRRLEIGAHPVAETDRLADVDDIPALVLHEIDARGRGKRA